VLGLGSYHIAWTWLHKLRRAMVRPGRDRLSGAVEVDEVYIGGEKPGKRGRGAAGKVLVVVMVEVTEGKIGIIRLRRVPDASDQVWKVPSRIVSSRKALFALMNGEVMGNCLK